HDPEMSEYHAGVLAHVSIYISYSVYVLIPVVYFLPEGSWRNSLNDRPRIMERRASPPVLAQTVARCDERGRPLLHSCFAENRGSLRVAKNQSYFLYTVGRGPFSSVSRSQIMSSRE